MRFADRIVPSYLVGGAYIEPANAADTAIGVRATLA